MAEAKLAEGTVSAIRTDCLTGKERPVTVEWFIFRQHFDPVPPALADLEGRLSLQLGEGAVTGYESFYVYADRLDECATRGWWACAGTKGRWDGLFIPASEMAKIVARIRELLP